MCQSAAQVSFIKFLMEYFLIIHLMCVQHRSNGLKASVTINTD